MAYRTDDPATRQYQRAEGRVLSMSRPPTPTTHRDGSDESQQAGGIHIMMLPPTDIAINRMIR